MQKKVRPFNQNIFTYNNVTYNQIKADNFSYYN